MNCPRRHACWQNKRLYWEGMPGRRAGGWENPGGPLCHGACSLRHYGDGISFQVVSGQSFWLSVLPGGTCIAQPRWMPVRRILGDGKTGGISFWPFQNYSYWWWLISSMFLVRNLLSWNNSSKWLLWCLARMGSFSQCVSPNIISGERMDV